MRPTTKSEFQMLREVAWFFLPVTPCYFCKLPLINEPIEGSTFGHRRHPAIDGKITVHHLDTNRNHNHRSNLAWAHSDCHRNYHAEMRRRNDPSNGQRDVP